MPQMDKELYFQHILALFAAFIIIYGHETGYGLFRTVESIKARNFYIKYYTKAKYNFSAEKHIIKVFIQNTLLYKNIL